MFQSRLAALEFDGDAVRVAVLERTRKGPKLLERYSERAAYTDEAERHEALVAAVERLFAHIQLAPHALALCASSERCTVRQLAVPFRGRRRVAAAVPFELEPYLAFPLEDLLVDFSIVREASGQTEVLAAGLRRSYVAEHLAILEAAGFQVDAVTLDAIALTRLWIDQERPARQLNAIVHVRERNASLAITSGKHLAFFRFLPHGADAFVDQPRVAARDIQNTLRSFLARWEGEGAIEALHITGLDTRVASLDPLQDAIGLPIEARLIAESALEASEPSGNDLVLNRWDAVLGAAVALDGGSMSFNFARPLTTVERFVRPVANHVLFSAGLMVVVLLGIAAYYWAGAGRYERVADTLRGRLAAIDEQLLALPPGLSSEEAALYTAPTLLEALDALGANLPEAQISVTEVSVSPPGSRTGWITVEGTATDSTAVSEAAEALRESDLWEIPEEPRIDLDGATTRFRLRTYLPEGT